mmetsp:Transcript_17712/g.24635  ORF Transcript_17712/g.24635 Transcript_17712/m.24635 type:complete len:422 (-) Transcript_17712:436-1701(-)
MKINCVLLFAVVLHLCSAALFEPQRSVRWNPLPYDEEVFRQPTHQEPIFNVRDYGAKGNGKTLDTVAIQKTIDAVSQNGGGEVYFPPGQYLTGSFNLTSNMTLFLDYDATIFASTNFNDFELVQALPSYPNSKSNTSPRYIGFVSGFNVSKVTITGFGTIDAQGLAWWKAYDNGELNYTRPCLIEFRYSNDIELSYIMLRNSPFYTVHPYTCSDVTVHHIYIDNPPGSPNTDGIDPDSSERVTIAFNIVSTTDDHVSMKSGKQQEGLSYAVPTQQVTISNNNFIVGAGMAIGSETAGNVTEIYFWNNTVAFAANAVRLKGCYAGYVYNVNYTNTIIEYGDVAVFADLAYECTTDPDFPPRYYNINIENLRGANNLQAGSFECPSEAPCQVNMYHVDLGSAKNFDCSNVEGETQNVRPIPCY